MPESLPFKLKKPININNSHRDYKLEEMSPRELRPSLENMNNFKFERSRIEKQIELSKSQLKSEDSSFPNNKMSFDGRSQRIRKKYRNELPINT
jgi:hypothetical protein